MRHRIGLNFAVGMLLCAFQASDSSVLAASKTDSSDPGKTAYVSDIERIYRDLANHKIETVSAAYLRPMPPRSSSTVRYSLPPELRLHTAPNTTSDADRNLAQKMLLLLEKEERENTVAAIEPLTVLYATSTDAEAYPYAERIASILEKAHAKSANDFEFLRSLQLVNALSQRSRNSLPPELSERLLRIQYKVMLANFGINSNSISALTSLASFLQSHEHAAEALALYKATESTLETGNASVPNSTKQMFRQRYITFLSKEHMDAEAANIKKKSDAALTELLSEQAKKSEAELKKAKAEAAIDPVALVKAQAKAAAAHLVVGDKAIAQKLFRKAMDGYAEILPINRDRELDEAIWLYVRRSLDTATTKDDEKVVAAYFDILDARYSQGHAMDVVAYYQHHHRNDAAIAFLEGLFEKQQRWHAPPSAIRSTADELVRLYQNADDSDKAQAVRQKLSASLAERMDSEGDVLKLMEAAQAAIDARSDVAKPLIAKTVQAIDEGKGANKLTGRRMADFAESIAKTGDIATAIKVFYKVYSLKLEKDVGYITMENHAAQIIRDAIDNREFSQADELIGFAYRINWQITTNTIPRLQFESLIAQAAAARDKGDSKLEKESMTKLDDAWHKVVEHVKPERADELQRERDSLLSKYGLANQKR